MKTLTKILIAATLGGAAISYACPGPQFWNRPAAKTVATTETSKPAATPVE
jgi:hypothetical protein